MSPKNNRPKKIIKIFPVHDFEVSDEYYLSGDKYLPVNSKK